MTNDGVKEDRDRSPAPLIVMGLMLLALTATLVLVRGNSDLANDQTALSEGGTTIIEDEGAGGETSETAKPDDTEPVADMTEETDLPAEPVEDAEPAIVNPAGPFDEPSVKLANGMVTLTGGQPDQSTADRIAGEVTAIVGAENVTNDFVLDSRAPAEGSLGLLETTDSITYVENSFRVSDASQRQLELTAHVLGQNPDAMLTITSHAATRGDSIVATQASQTDADRLFVFFSERDVESERIVAIGLGSALPLDADAPELPVNKRSYLTVSLP